jgi:3,4-dihydroxy-2-butanone 4-phosphate synthase
MSPIHRRGNESGMDLPFSLPILASGSATGAFIVSIDAICCTTPIFSSDRLKIQRTAVKVSPKEEDIIARKKAGCGDLAATSFGS